MAKVQMDTELSISDNIEFNEFTSKLRINAFYKEDVKKLLEETIHSRGSAKFRNYAKLLNKVAEYAEEKEADDENRKLSTMFQITSGRGFRMKFDNGYTVSVQWGVYNYCDHKGHSPYPKDTAYPDLWSSSTAEIGAYHDSDKELIDLKDWREDEKDTAAGYMTTADVLDFMNWVSKLPEPVNTKNKDNELEM